MDKCVSFDNYHYFYEMKKHTKIYLDYFGYCEQDFIVCEIPDCRRQAVDINHIIPRGMGGSKTKDFIENLVAMCREHHIEFEQKKISKEYLQQIHNQNL